MKLFYTQNSPYSRKVRLCAIEKGVMDNIELIVCPPSDNSPDLHKANPLGKIPALVLDSGEAIYDSPVICEYLDTLSSKNPLFPKDVSERIQVRKTEALADGLMDATVARFLELMRPETERSPRWIGRWEDAIKRSLDVLESGQEKLPQGVTIGSLSLAAALGYVDLRHTIDLKKSYPKVSAWQAEFEKRPSIQLTMPEKT